MTLNPHIKLALDFLPLAAFFVGFKGFGLYAATGSLLVATILATGIIYWFERKLALAPIITAIVVGIFGGLTLWLHNETFIKIKPTLVNLIFAAILLGGCMRGKGLLKPVLGTAFALTERGWFVLSRRWGIFFLCLAGLNELVWRSVSTDVWVDFKVFGLIGFTTLFAIAQMGVMRKYEAKN